MDTRPTNCRHRLHEEGKAYPRSNCQACGKNIFTGLGNVCEKDGRTHPDLASYFTNATDREMAVLNAVQIALPQEKINLVRLAISLLDPPTQEWLIMPSADGRAMKMTYTNHKGVTAVRTIVPRKLWFGHTEYHPEDQWLFEAYDLDKMAYRDFALKDCDFTKTDCN